MTSDWNKNASIHLLAAYGTLRDDDNSGAAWTRDFIRDISSATTGKVAGFRLFSNPAVNYPVAIFTGNPNDSVVVRLLHWPSEKQFQEKIHLADRIEGDEYERKMVEVLVEGDSKMAYIYVGKTEFLNDNWKIIPSGDWLQRPLL